MAHSISIDQLIKQRPASPVGFDSTGWRIVGFGPTQIEHLRLCAANGLGSGEGFEVVGERVEDHATMPIQARHSAVSGVDKTFRRPLIERLVFHTPLFKVTSWGARHYYDLWDWRIGQFQRRDFFARSKYVEQWS